MIIKRNTILFLSTTFLGASISAAADSTAAAAVRKLQEPALQQTFSGRGAPPTPLPQCHGDCDNDNHCAGDLVCFQRFDYEPVPGCTGNGFRKVDFCAERATDNTLWMKGNNGRPSRNFPLGLCEGDCDSDAECQPGLVCQERTGDEPVPGCIGDALPGEDYCRPDVPVTPAPTPPVTPPPTLPPTSLQVVFSGSGEPPSPLLECQGDCDDDTQCADDLVCFQRSGTEAVPGCPGEASSGVDFCAVRATANTAWLKGDNGSPAENFPLGLCEGDCDSDSNCHSGLVCQQRSGDEPIPGCIGVPEPGEDYCRPAEPTTPPTPQPTSSVTPPVTPNPTPPTSSSTLQVVFIGSGDPPSPLLECQGDCDNDTQCDGDLVCFQRSENESVPGCTGSTTSGTDFCAVRATANTAWLKGDNGIPAENFPLGLCEGDCDSDSNCQSGLVCQQRSGDEPIPGCIGVPEPGEDYCRPAEPTTPPTPQPTSSVTPPVTPNPTPPTSSSTLQVVFIGSGDPPSPLLECQGDCDNDAQCDGDLVCFQRSENESVPGCTGSTTSGTDFCAVRATANTAWLKGDNGIPAENFPLGLCEGDCDSDANCQSGLVCQQRSGDEPIPGCIGVAATGEDYCRPAEPTTPPTPQPTSSVTPPVTPNPTPPTSSSTLQVVFIGSGDPPSPLLECQGDCDNDAQCDGDLVCFQRSENESVPGCTGSTTSGTDFCAVRATANTAWLKGDNGIPAENFPLGLCEGDCDSDSNCQSGLVCQQRTGDEPIPGCIGVAATGEDYCRPQEIAPTTPPGPQPTYAPNTFGATFVPGDLSQPCDGGKLMLSKGMDCRLLTTAGQYVQYDNGGQSDVPMHGRADGAAVIAHPDDGGWYYTSNSENGSGNGGVGTLRFNAQGEVIGYKMDLEGTTRNCGGGKTYWDTWVTCEEDGSRGFCWEVDPFTGHTAKTNAVIVGGNYESFAYDDQDPEVEARFFTTEDSGNGPLVRYTPAEAAFNTGNKYHILTSDGGTHDYLVLNTDGTFFWSTSESAGASSASTYFPNAEGIDVINRQLFFVSKVNKELFELDLAAGTWIVTSTVSGAFDKQPDQIQKVVGDSDFLYFCEDGGSFSDIHGRNKDGQFFTIVRGDGYGSETSGLAFSPDNKFMYVAFQGNSNVYAFWRQDGLDFGAAKADIKYHQT